MKDMRKNGIVTIRRGLKKARIPIDGKGYVPKWAIAEHYNLYGRRSDGQKTDIRVLPNYGLTPELIADWWFDPNCMDIQDVDTRGAAWYSVPRTIRGRKRAALKRIPIIADDPKEATRIRKEHSKSFTAEQLEKQADLGLILEIRDSLSDCTGYYIRKQKGVAIPRIIYEKGTSPDGIVHEMVHHQRVVDGRTAFPTSRHTKKLKERRYAHSDFDAIERKEERETVAETQIRMSGGPVSIRDQSGYYDTIPGVDPRKAYLADRKRMNPNGKPITGKKTIKQMEKEYSNTYIARARIQSQNVRKRGTGKTRE